MIKLAVVGDIGSGKSYAAKKFGYPVFDADVEVTKLYKTSKKCFVKLKKLLPQHIISFPIKKTELLKAIMINESNIKKITKVIHPEVRIKMNKFLIKNRNKKIVVLDIPLLLENKINKKNDVLIFVDAKKSQINKRLKRRKNFNLKLFKKFKKIQLPIEYKKKKSQFILKNNFTNKFVKKRCKNNFKKNFINVRSDT